MDFMQKINDLRAQKGQLLAKAEQMLADNASADVTEITNQMDAINGQIQNMEKLAQASQSRAQTPAQKSAEDTDPHAKAVKNLAQAARMRFDVRNAAAGTPMTEGVSADGGYTVPEDIVADIIAIRDSEESLLSEVTVQSTYTMKGRRTVKTRSQHVGFATVAEAAKYPLMATPTFETVEFNIEKRGGVIPTTQELYEDSDANIVAFITEWLGGEARATANREILEAVSAGFESTDLTGLDGILTAWIKLGSAYRGISKLYTNDDGLAWLGTLKDANERHLLNPNPANPSQLQLSVGPYTLPIKTYSNDTMPSNGTKAPMILGSLKDAVWYWDRKSFSVQQSNVAVVGKLNAFEQDLIMLKGTLRDDTTVVDTKAIVNGFVDTAAAAG